MGKHDSDEGMGFFLGGAETVKNVTLGIKKNLKIIFIIALIPLVGFGAYQGVKYFSNKNNTTPAMAVVPDVKQEEPEYIGGYQVVGTIKIKNIGIEVKVLNPVIDDVDYTEDALNYGAVLYYGNGINEIGNCSILGHNTANCFLNLKNIEENNQITVADSNGVEVDYSVTSIDTIEADDLSVLLDSDETSKEITLITCDEAGTTRYVVKAISK